jgi:hypothetical protein
MLEPFLGCGTAIERVGQRLPLAYKKQIACQPPRGDKEIRRINKLIEIATHFTHIKR